ncbi:MAG: ExeA family protein [Opitutales bacterium]|jgi:type II secretory pathway predicted ATPase ExeA
MKHKEPETKWIHQAKTMWGAQHFPFLELSTQESYECSSHQTVLSKIEQMLSLGCSGILTGANGTGKSHLLRQLSNRLHANGNQVIFISHTTIKPNALIRSICRELGIKATYRKEDNVCRVHEYCAGQQPTQTILLIDEAANLPQETLEELRLLKCYISTDEDRQYSLPVLLCGDENLYHRLCMRYFKPLLSRLHFTKELPAFDQAETSEYLNHHLHSSRIHKKIFDTQSIDVIFQVSAGNPRIINSIGLQAIGLACERKQDKITSELLTEVIEEIPWLNLLQN